MCVYIDGGPLYRLPFMLEYMQTCTVVKIYLFEGQLPLKSSPVYRIIMVLHYAAVVISH